MSRNCNKCCHDRPVRTKYGFFVRASDQKRIQRFRCKRCGRIFSDATFQECYQQKKRRINPRVYELLCSGVSQRRSAKLLKVTRKTIARKLIFLAKKIHLENKKHFLRSSLVSEFQFDDLETFEHTKLKPLSVTMAVEKSTRRILGFEVSSMPAKGLLSKLSYKKYGRRPDLRGEGRRKLFMHLKEKVMSNAFIESDSNPHYPKDVRAFFPHATHKTTIGGRSAVVGQGELKKLKFDPLFSLNHTYAMVRANVNRCFRKTWCTTKVPARLRDHLELYVHFHNHSLLPQAEMPKANK
jgi:transposase-like protein